MPKTDDTIYQAAYDAVKDAIPSSEELIFNAIKAGVTEAIGNYLEEHGLQ